MRSSTLQPLCLLQPCMVCVPTGAVLGRLQGLLSSVLYRSTVVHAGVPPILSHCSRLNKASLDAELPCELCMSQALTLVMAGAHLELQGFC